MALTPSRNCALPSGANVVIDFPALFKQARRALFGGRPCADVKIAVLEAERMAREARGLKADIKRLNGNGDPFHELMRNIHRSRPD